MILVFDLDDTLYPEITYVHSGLRAVAEHLEKHQGLCAQESFAHMLHALEQHGRGQVFDQLLKSTNLFSKARVRQCLSIYRQHHPAIKLYQDALIFLQQWQHKVPLYLVTDGNKHTQVAKISALKIDDFFKKMFITRRYGLDKEKPSLYCFEKICRLERCGFDQLVYVGDNPAKDFVNLKKAGGLTVRMLKGMHKDVVADQQHDADYHVHDFIELEQVLNAIVAADKV